MNRILFIGMFWIAAGASAAAAATITFEDHALAPNSYYNGGTTTSNNDGWSSGGASFNNSYTAYSGGSYWNGWSYSNVSDTTTAGYTNQYAAFTGSGFGGSGNYAVAFDPAYINLPAGQRPLSVQLTNTTYTALSMLQGDAFAGPKYTTGDYFSVTLTGYSAAGATGPRPGPSRFTWPTIDPAPGTLSTRGNR